MRRLELEQQLVRRRRGQVRRHSLGPLQDVTHIENLSQTGILCFTLNDIRVLMFLVEFAFLEIIGEN